MKGTLLVLLFAALPGMAASAQSGMYLRLGDVEGEQGFGPYKGWIEIESMDTEWSRPDAAVSGAARRRSQIVVGDIVVTKPVDASTPKLMEYAATGMIIPAAAIVLERNGNPYVRYDLRNVLVDAYSVGANLTGTLEEVALQYEEILITYLPDSKSQYSGSFQWNLRQ